MNKSSDKVKIFIGGFMEGYWHLNKTRGAKPEKICMPLPFSPNANIKDCYFEEIDKNKITDYVKVIDPKEHSYAEIKKICEYNNIPFYWVTGINQHNRKKINLSNNDPLKKAIDYFLMLLSENSVAQYERLFENLKKMKIINDELSIEKYKFSQNQILDEIYTKNFFQKEKNYKREETRLKYYYIFIAFHKFLEDPLYFNKKTSKIKYKTKRQNPLTKSEAKKFFPALKKINSIHELIAKILWQINHNVGKGDILATIESVLRMRTEDFDPQFNVITVYYHKIICNHMTSVEVPNKISYRLSKLWNPDEVFIFRNKYGAPIDPGQLRKSFLKACIKANLDRSISPSNIF